MNCDTKNNDQDREAQCRWIGSPRPMGSTENSSELGFNAGTSILALCFQQSFLQGWRCSFVAIEHLKCGLCICEADF